MTISSRPDNATIARHGLSDDAGVLVVTGRVIIVVGGIVFGRVVVMGTGVELVAGNRGVNVSRDVTSGSPRSSNP
jgi:hypothetical protein